MPRACPLPSRDLYPNIKTSLHNVWQIYWDNIGSNKMREITGKICPWKYGNMTRTWEVVLCRLRIGHTRLTHGFLMAGDPQPFCDDCLVPLTVRHLLVECPSLGELRDRFMSGSRGEDGSFLLAAVLGEEVNYDNSGVFRFVAEAGLMQQI